MKRLYGSNGSGDFCRESKRQFIAPNSALSMTEALVQIPNDYQNVTSTDLGPAYEGASRIVDHGDGDVWMQDVVYEDTNGECSASTVTLAASGDYSTAESIEEDITARVEEICFGMICDVKSKFVDNTRIFDEANFPGALETKHEFHRLSIRSRQNYFVLQSSTETDIAVLNTNVSCCFRNLSDCSSVHYEGFVAVDEWADVTKFWKNTGKTSSLSVNINVYGSHSDFETVGKVFSKAGLYFQHPYHCGSNRKYDNPHYLSLPNTLDATIDTIATTLIPAQGAPIPTQYDISFVLENLDQPQHLHCVEIDSRIQTPLLSHQIEAVDYIATKEAGIVTEASSLWKLNEEKAGRSFYQHLITGSKRPIIPEGPSGGILADEMGLGKSLTMLSAIVGSFQSAESFAQSGFGSVKSQRNQRLATKATLVVVPSALLLDGWIEEVCKHILPGTLCMHKYHGSRRETDLSKLRDFDIIFTTYATLAAEFGLGSNGLHRMKFFRLVLDEAQSIRHETTKQFRAVSTISAKFRWCLSGTPIQNSLEDLGALIKFLRVPLLETAAAFRQYVTHPIESGDRNGFSNLRLLLNSICLRRTNDILHLPKPVTLSYQLELSCVEDEEYANIGETYRREIDKAVSGQRTAEAYNGILQAILRLRLLCNHGTYEKSLQTCNRGLPSDPDEAIALLQQSDDVICAYCSGDIVLIGNSDDPESASLTICSHVLCRDCVPQYNADLGKANQGCKTQCPLCYTVIGENAFTPKIEKKGGGSGVCLPASPAAFTSEVNGGYSSKLSTLMKDIESHLHKDKSIVFSSWKKTLDLVASLFVAKRIPYISIDGSLSLPERTKALSDFHTNPEVTVLLMTLGTGAVGLNLTVASRIHILEPQWNPSAENQAIGRALRLGQEKEVTVIRYIVKNTIEEYIKSRQSRKLQLATVGWEREGGNQEEQKLKKLRQLRSLVIREN